MWWRRNQDKLQGTRGFVLLEVLVTAAVAAVLLLVVMRAFTSVWLGIGGVREETEAMLVARAVIDTSTPRRNLAPGMQQGTSGRYAWTVAVADTGIQAVMDEPERQTQSSQQPAGARPATAREQSGNTQQPQRAGEPWTLFRIAVEVKAPSGRSTSVETYRLSRSAR